MKRQRFGRLLALAAGLMTTALVASACGGGEAEGGDKELTIGYVAWDDAIAVSNLYKVQLEKKGYEVELQQLDAAPTYEALSKGDIDLFLDGWLPTTHKQYWEKYQDDLEDLGAWYDNATLDLAVPSYVDDVNSIADLKSKASKFEGTITGIDPGAGEMGIVKDDVMPQYGLNGAMKLQSSSSTAMLAALDGAIKKKQPIVVTLWHPHWAYSRYDLKDLEDPKGAMGEGEKIHSLGRQGFGEDFPELTKMIKSFRMSDTQLSSLENAIHEAGSGNELDATKEWAEKNKGYADKAFAGA